VPTLFVDDDTKGMPDWCEQASRHANAGVPTAGHPETSAAVGEQAVRWFRRYLTPAAVALAPL